MYNLAALFQELCIVDIVIALLSLVIGVLARYSKWRIFGLIFYGLYLSFVISMTGLPNVVFNNLSPHINLDLSMVTTDLLGYYLNVGLFMPVGFLLPLISRRFQNVITTTLYGAFLSFIVEVMQLFCYRATDILDLLTNTLGTLLGWIVGYLMLRIFSSTAKINYRSAWPVLLTTLMVFLVMFFIQPYAAMAFGALF